MGVHKSKSMSARVCTRLSVPLSPFLHECAHDCQYPCPHSSRISSRIVLLVLVDETKLADHLSIMVVALAYRKRAIPVAWPCYHQQAWPCSPVQLIAPLPNQVA